MTKDIYQDFNQHLYDELWDNIDKYEIFNMLYINGHPIGMAGINTHYYQPGVARVLDRAYHFHRSIDGLKNLAKRISYHLLPYQVSWCRDNNMDIAFMSMEPKGNMKRWQRLIGDRLNKEFDMNFKYQDGFLFNVCAPLGEYCNNDDSCWQGITVYKMSNNNDFCLPAIKE